MNEKGNVVIGTMEAVNETDPEQLYYIQNGCKYRVYISRHHGWEYFISRDRAERSARRSASTSFLKRLR